ncbi:MAG: hypothetical protein QM737_03085 [Ferruginibacter sp.]
MKKIFILISTLAIIFCSCKKKHDDNIINPANSPAKLMKVVSLNTNATAPYDTLRVENYGYDGAWRVTNVDTHGYDGVVNFTEAYTYNYNGTDTLPFLTMTTYDDINEHSSSSSWRTYVAGTRNILVDSTIAYQTTGSGTSSDTFVIHYSYTATTLQMVEDSYTSSGHQTFGPSTINITKQNGNITFQQQIFGSNTQTYNCTYDTHPNPYYNVAWYNNTMIPSIYKYFPDCFGLNNNVTEINITSASTGNPTTVSHYTYSYQYRSDGYPTEITVQDQGSTDPGSLTKVIYSYYPTN